MEPEATKHQDFNCTACGAVLEYAPGTKSLKCQYCGNENEIKASGPVQVEETSFKEHELDTIEGADQEKVRAVSCKSCGATTTVDANVKSGNCPFCDSPFVLDAIKEHQSHKPNYLLPFTLDQKAAFANFQKWIGKLWFAPSKLKEYAKRADKFIGVYLPFWTFDANTRTNYTGLKGIDYTETQTYTAVEDGKNVTRTRTVTKTNWYPASGTVNNTFDDILRPATRSVPTPMLDKLEPWDLPKLTAYEPAFLAGFRTETSSVALKVAFGEAKGIMDKAIESSIRRDIGGDRQQIHFKQTDYRNTTFKHVLLPVWISSYRFKNKVYQVLVNARTGEVQGKRPYSVGKIALAVIIGLAIIGIIYLFVG